LKRVEEYVAQPERPRRIPNPEPRATELFFSMLAAAQTPLGTPARKLRAPGTPLARRGRARGPPPPAAPPTSPRGPPPPQPQALPPSYRATELPSHRATEPPSYRFQYCVLE